MLPPSTETVIKERFLSSEPLGYTDAEARTNDTVHFIIQLLLFDVVQGTIQVDFVKISEASYK